MQQSAQGGRASQQSFLAPLHHRTSCTAEAFQLSSTCHASSLTTATLLSYTPRADSSVGNTRVLVEITQSSLYHHRHHPALSTIPKRSAYYSRFCLRRILRSAAPRASARRLTLPFERPSPHFRVFPLCSAAVILSSYFLATEDIAGLSFGERILHHSARL